MSIELLSKVLGIGVSLYTLGRYVIWPYLISPVVLHVSRINKLTKDVEKILTEITPNGGKSIKDSICRIDDTLSKVACVQKLVIDSLKDCIFELDSNGGLIWANASLISISGYQIREIEGLGWKNLFGDCSEDIEAAIKDGRNLHTKLDLINAERKNITVNLDLFVMKGPNNCVKGYLCFIEKSK